MSLIGRSIHDPWMLNHYPKWRDEFVLSREQRALGRYAELVSDVRRGVLIPVTRGVFRRAASIERDPVRHADDAFLARVRATQLLAGDRELVFAGLAAAAIWQLPIIGQWPERVSVATPPAGGGRSNSRIARSYVGHLPPSVAVDSLRVTGLRRTVVDVGRTCSFEVAVAIADAALRGQENTSTRRERAAITIAALARELGLLGSAPGVAKCRGVLEFADGRSGSPGESLSRVGIHRLGLPAPELQVPFYDQFGLIGIVDFWWPHAKLIGEFDGVGKYVREEFADGRTMAEIVMAEKAREDRLRALGPGVARWGWTEARSLPALNAKLAALR